MRDLIAARLRQRYPSARIIHELALRDGTNRIDMAAITETLVIAVEIKSSKDVLDRLEAQIRAFVPVTHRLLVCLAPKHNEQLPDLVTESVVRGPGYQAIGRTVRRQRTPAQELIEAVGDRHTETWTIDVPNAESWQTRGGYLSFHDMRLPWAARMLDMLWNAELYAIAGAHGVWSGGKHDVMVDRLTRLLTGEQIVAGVCRELRRRAAFAVGSDPPVDGAGAPALVDPDQTSMPV